MKKVIIFAVLIYSIGLSADVFADDSRVIALKDGSIIKGKVVQMANGVYTIRTENLGTIKVKSANILSIKSPALHSASQQNNTHHLNNTSNNTIRMVEKANLQKQVKEIQNSILQDPKVMTDIQKLLQNQEIMSLMSDKSILDDVMSYDPQRIGNNQKIKQLMENPEMKRLMDRLKIQVQGHGSSSH